MPSSREDLPPQGPTGGGEVTPPPEEATPRKVVYKKEKNPLLKGALISLGTLLTLVVGLFLMGLIMGFMGANPITFDPSNLMKRVLQQEEKPATKPSSPTSGGAPSSTSSTLPLPQVTSTLSPQEEADAEAAGREAGRIFRQYGVKDPSAFWQGFNSGARRTR